MEKPKRLTITGRAYWAKVLPDQLHDKYNDDGREWSLDVAVDPETIEKLNSAGLGPKIKDKGGDRGPFITFTRNELKKGGDKQGEPNMPIRIEDRDGNEWSGGPLGNGSLVEVEFNVFQVQDFKKKTLFHLKPVILSIKVLDHVVFTTMKPIEKKGPVKVAPTENWDVA